jgi:hypothetical protein
MAKRAKNPCSVSGNSCIAPAGRGTAGGISYGTKDAKNLCDACGLPVCGKCSRVWWIGRDRERRCDHCEARTRSFRAALSPQG